MSIQPEKALGAVLWDVDGVLINSYDENGVFFWSRTIERDLGITDAVVAAIFKTQGDLSWNDVLLGRKDTRTHIKEVFTQHGAHLPVDVFIEYWLSKDVAPNEIAAGFLNPETASIATNQDPLRARHLEKIFQGRIKRMFTSSSLGFAKPDAKYFMHIENTLSLPPHRLALIDDTLENVEAAKSRGWLTHHYTTANRLCAFMRNIAV